MELTVENLERAVSQFYHTHSVLQAEAHQWLTAVQASTNAWAVVWELLQPQRSVEAQFFAATTLHTKLMKNWSEVPLDQYGILKNKLLESIVQYSNGPKIVLDRLCIALSAYLIQTTPHYWEDSLNELITMFHPKNLPNVEPERVAWILLEVLTVIPEELQTMTMGHRHKNCVRDELEKAIPSVISIIEGSLNCVGEVRIQGVKALSAWHHIGLPLPSCLPMAQSIVATALLDSNTFGELESDCLSQMGTNPDSHRHPNAVLALLNILLPLGRLIETAAAEDDKEFLCNLYKVFVNLGEYHGRMVLNWLASGEGSARALIRLLLDCTAAPGQYPIEETHSQLTFGFWYILQDEMNSLSMKDEAIVMKEVLIPAYEELTRVLLRKSQYPPSGIQMSSLDTELFRCYRQDIADTLIYCFYVVRGYMISFLESSLASATHWEEAEAVLAGAFAVAQTTQEDARLVALLTRVPEQHLAHPRVVNTLNQAIGAYSEWLSGQTEALGSLIPVLVRSLQSTETSLSSTMALKDVTRECTLSLTPYATPLLSACQEALGKGHLRQSECIRLMYSIGRLLSILPYNQMISILEPLANDYATAIDHLLSQQVSSSTKSSLYLQLRMASTLLGTLYSEDGTPPMASDPPSFILLGRLLPSLGRVSSSPSWSTDPSIASEVSSCLKNASTSLLERIEPFLVPVLNTLLSTYLSQPHPQALEVARQLVCLFSKAEGRSGALIVELMSSLIDSTVRLIANGGEDSGSRHSDVLQAFLILLASVIRKHTSLLPRSTDVVRLFAFGTLSLLLPEIATVKAAGSFLCSFITKSREEDSFLVAVQKNGEHLLHTVVRCIAGETPRSGLDIFPDLLLSLNQKHCDSLSRWLPPAVAQWSGLRVNDEQKLQFTRGVLRERVNKRKLQDIVREYAFTCRGLITSDYTPRLPHKNANV